MSVEAHVIAIGPHTPELAKHYEYSPADYDAVPAGQQICTMIGPNAHTWSLSHELCDILGCTLDAPRSWTIDIAKIDQAAIGHFHEQEQIDDLLQAIRDLHAAGFTFFLRVDR